MRISPALLLLMLMILVFSPSIEEWATRGGANWYRPYALWLILNLFVWWAVRRGLRRQDQAEGPQAERKE